MFEAPQCALKSNQPSVSGTNCNEKMSENAFSLALNWRCVLLWWRRREVVSGLSQAQSSGALQVHSSPCCLWVSGHAVGSWCGMLLVGVSCKSLCFPAPAECSGEALPLCDQGRKGSSESKGCYPLVKCVCVLKKNQYQGQLVSASDITIICSMGTCSIVP